MRASLILPTAALVLLPAQAEEGSAKSPGLTMAVVMKFDQQYSPVSLAAMERELESIMSACNLSVQWRMLNDSTSKETFNDLVVARFRGKCRGNVPRTPRRGRRTLGLTYVSEGDVLPFSEVDCDRIRSFVQPRLAREKAGRVMDELLGRALGRVLAHELYHMLAKTGTHARAGVAKAMFTPSDLVAGRLRLGVKQAEEIRRSLRRTLHPAIESASAAR
jgi:hypothetical protein